MKRHQVPGAGPVRVVRPLAQMLGISTLAASFAVPAAAQFALDWFTIDGGGAMQSSGGAYTLGGTIGQPDAGPMSGGNFELGGGFWMAGSAVMVGIAEGNAGISTGALPLTFRIHPPAPNPLTERTVVSFDIPQARNVKARVYDVAGRLTRTLAEGPLPAGQHKRVWDGTNESGRRVTAGMYFVVLDAGADRAKQKILVLK